MHKTTFLIIGCMFALSACGTMPGNSDYSLILEDHALSEKIWDVKAGHFVDRQKLIESSQQSEFILLGETHDNLLHHQYQAWVIDNLYKSGYSAFAAFEMISKAQGDQVNGKQYSTSAELISDLNQVKTTWRYEQRYRPVFNSVITAGYDVYSANLDRATIMTIARKGDESIPSYLKAYLQKNPLTEEQEKALREEIKMSHCGMENPHMTKAMMLTQRVKDSTMTHSLMRDAGIKKRLLIAGSGHVRNDRGVPMYIRSEDSGAKILTIAWLEVVEGLTEIKQYSQRWGGKMLPFDYVWFTARMDRPDPCKSFREHMKNKTKKGK